MERHAAERPAVLDDLTGPRPAERPRQVDEGDRRSFAGHVAGYGPDRAAGEAVWDRFAAGGPDHLAEPVGPDDHVRGPATAPATVVVYGDYQCPYTRRALREIARLERRLGDRFRLVFRHFPLREIHPHAEAAAELAEAAAEQGKFWEVHDYLFAHQAALDPAHLAAYARQFGIPNAGSNPRRFEAGDLYAERVEADRQGGLRSGVGGTPTVFIDGRRHDGGYDEATLQLAIERAG